MMWAIKAYEHAEIYFNVSTLKFNYCLDTTKSQYNIKKSLFNISKFKLK